jgi:heat shock protein HslJ
VVVVVDSFVASRRVTSREYVPALVIERFVAIEPDGVCAPKGSAPLEGTYWKLVRIGERPAAAIDPKAEPHLLLDRNSRRVSGSGGCNRFTGGYALDGDRITFTDLAPTRMFCAPAMDQERAYFGALAPAGRWRVDGQRLELFGPAGDRLLFEAVKPR